MDIVRQRRRKAFWAAFWGALAAPSVLFGAEPPRITRVETSSAGARDSMRGDWVRIGGDFGRVIASEEARTARH